MFYDQNRRMILNRNQTVKVVGSEDAYERRLALHDAVLGREEIHLESDSPSVQ
jgi:hypothetical protein